MAALNENRNDTRTNSVAAGSVDRRYKWRYGPLRLAMPWIAVAAGIIGIVKSLGGLGGVQDGAHTPFLWGGIGLIALGIIFFFVYRWMAKKGI